ncbi:hypothetical protein [Anaerotruncus colihominis]|nr:hypothetical protein [Anaerotruncus colihominis]
MRSRRGSDMVEATIVIPLLILVVCSLILLIVYYYACLDGQLNLHERLQEEAAESRAVYKKLEDRDSVSKQLRGVSSIVMENDIFGRIYAVYPSQIIRLGEAAGIDVQQ